MSLQVDYSLKKQPPKRLRGQYPNVSIYHQSKHREPNGYFLQNISLNKQIQCIVENFYNSQKAKNSR